MARTRVDAEFKRRASLAIVWQDLVMPVRAIPDYQKIIVEEGQCLQLDPRLLRGQFVFLGPAPLDRDSEIKSYSRKNKSQGAQSFVDVAAICLRYAR